MVERGQMIYQIALALSIVCTVTWVCLVIADRSVSYEIVEDDLTGINNKE